ncbi:hypothetical protein KY342_00410 [Candidatus Woesearchaeota archaeon]|nr:hypothetical protein [Candidatus Woesearchaeota archaeon]
MGVLKVFLLIIVFLLVINVSTASTLESYNVNYNIVDNKVLVQNVLISSNEGDIILPIPNDAETIELYLNDIKVDPVIKDDSIILNLSVADQAKLSYITREFIDKSNFLLNLPIGYDTNFIEITLVLPEEAVLKKPISDTTGSIYPKPDKATTDGRSLIFAWERANIEAGNEISIFALYKTRINYNPIIVAAFIGFVVLGLLGYILYKILFKDVEKGTKKDSLEEHLKEEEQQIARILKQREGQCEQGTLRVITGFSKAHLSRLLMELESRRIIYKEKRGKKNLIFLK